MLPKTRPFIKNFDELLIVLCPRDSPLARNHTGTVNSTTTAYVSLGNSQNAGSISITVTTS